MENLRAAMMAMVLMMGWLGIVYPMVAMGSPEVHKVGGSKGWTSHDVNYTQWSAQEHVHLGDWLLFNFDKRYFNVLEVNETNYEKCIDKNFIKNITHGGRDVVQLTEARTYYYLSSGGYCFQGMKVAVHVEDDLAAPAPAPAAESSHSPLSMYTGTLRILGNVLFIGFILWGII